MTFLVVDCYVKCRLLRLTSSTATATSVVDCDIYCRLLRRLSTATSIVDCYVLVVWREWSGASGVARVMRHELFEEVSNPLDQTEPLSPRGGWSVVGLGRVACCAGLSAMRRRE